MRRIHQFKVKKMTSQAIKKAVLVLFLTLTTITATDNLAAEELAFVPVPPGIQAFRAGETLTYKVSWSKILTAGTATMTVETLHLPGGREVLKFSVTGRTSGLVDRVYPVNDTVLSVFDPLIMQSISYSLRESYGGKKRVRVMTFDHAKRTVVSRLNDDPPETLDTPDPVQDGLSCLYSIRAMTDFSIGRIRTIDVVDSGKNWSIEVHTLGREAVKTPAGTFDTIRIKTRPTYQGVFLNKGEVFIWLTDDSRRVPVLMKSKLKVGSFVFTLTEMKPNDKPVK